jgi:hypothetical protein
VLSAHSHFYEFRCLDTGRLLPAWKLEEGQAVQPFLWCANGMFRYPLADRLRVTGFYSSVPCLEFEGRLASTDLVGEKIESAFVGELLREMGGRHRDAKWGGVFAVRDQRRYVLTMIGDCDAPEMSGEFEAGLMRNHHYRIARELGQLQASIVKRVSSIEVLQDGLASRGAVKGQLKVEDLRQIESLI